MKRRILISVVVALVLAPPLLPARAAQDSLNSTTPTERLASLGKLWGAVKFFHPYPAYKDIDWDAALIKAIPQIKAAETMEKYRQAVNEMLQALGDPLTTVETSASGNASAVPAGENKEPVYYRNQGGVIVVTALDWTRAMLSGNNAWVAKQTQMLEEIGKAKGVVLDCRYGPTGFAEAPPFYFTNYFDALLPSLVQGTVTLGTERYRMHSGYIPQRGNSSSGYSSALMTLAPGAIQGRATGTKPLAIVIDERTPDLTSRLSGLQSAGAKVVQVGGSDATNGGQTDSMMLAGGLRVRIRTTESIQPNGSLNFQADALLPAATSDAAVLSKATAMLDAPAKSAAPTVAAAPSLLSVKDRPYAQMTFPSEEYRLLALFRFWCVINYFFPYKHLIDKPWSTVLPDFIPRFLENKTALDYQMTVAEMVARLQDTHGFVSGLTVLDEQFGTYAPPLMVGAAGEKLVVRRLVDEEAAKAAGAQVGDVVLAVDGEPVQQRAAFLAKFRSFSTPQSVKAYVYPGLLRGAKDSTAKLRIEGADGQARDIEIKRTVPLGSVAQLQPRKTPIYEVLPNGYGYIDLARLPNNEAHKAMNAVMETPALIFDMRGYPKGTAWQIGPRLTEKKNVTGALFRRPFLEATALGAEDFGGLMPDYSFAQPLPPAMGAIYKGKVVVLINEDAISQSEHTCLFFESATDVTFIGSPTIGANGDVTNLVLPGGIFVNFTGHDVRHADGRQLQRVGIQPHISIEPTPAGIRAGKDEVLERAFEFLKQTLRGGQR